MRCPQPLIRLFCATSNQYFPEMSNVGQQKRSHSHPKFKADDNFRFTFGDLVHVGVGGYLGQMLPEATKRSLA